MIIILILLYILFGLALLLLPEVKVFVDDCVDDFLNYLIISEKLSDYINLRPNNLSKSEAFKVLQIVTNIIVSIIWIIFYPVVIVKMVLVFIFYSFRQKKKKRALIKELS